MLTLYNYLESLIEEHNGRQWYFETRLIYFASDVFDMLEVPDTEERISATNRGIIACRSLGIPIAGNFKKIYRYNGAYMSIDWKISPLASYLITINCNPSNQNVAKAQLYFAMNQTTLKTK